MPAMPWRLARYCPLAEFARQTWSARRVPGGEHRMIFSPSTVAAEAVEIANRPATSGHTSVTICSVANHTSMMRQGGARSQPLCNVFRLT